MTFESSVGVCVEYDLCATLTVIGSWWQTISSIEASSCVTPFSGRSFAVHQQDMCDTSARQTEGWSLLASSLGLLATDGMLVN